LEDDSGDEVIASKPAPPKPAPKRPAAKVLDTPLTTCVEDAVSVLEKLSLSPDAAKEIPKSTEANDIAEPAAAAKTVAPKNAPTKKAPAKKAPAKKAPPKKKAPAKKAAKKYDSSDEEDSDDFMGDGSDSEVEVVVSAPVPARERSGRAAAKKVTYVMDASDEDSDF
jgi:hypothetical protein